MSGNGRKIATQRATPMRRATGVRPKRETHAFALIEAVRGTTPPGSFAQLPAREIPQAIETRSWDSASLRRCRETKITLINMKRARFLLPLIFIGIAIRFVAVELRASSAQSDRAGIDRLHQQDVEATLSDKADELAKLWDADAIRIQPGRAAEVGKATIYADDERRVGKECRSRWSPEH